VINKSFDELLSVELLGQVSIKVEEAFNLLR